MKKNWLGSLRTKIIAWSFVPTAIILSAVAWFTFYSYQQVLGDLAIKQDWAIVQLKALEAGTAIGNLINTVLRPVVLDIDVDREAPLAVRAQTILDQAKNLEQFDGGIYFLDPQGKVSITWPAQPELHGQDWSDTPQFRYILSHRGAAGVTNIRAVGPDQVKIICAAWPMLDLQGEFVGAGYFCYDIEPAAPKVLYTLLNSLALGPDAYLLDGNQRVVYAPDPAQFGQDLSQEPSIQQLLQGQSMSSKFRKGGEAMVISYYPITGTIDDRVAWVLIKEQSWAAVMQPSLPYRQLLLVLLALGVVVPVLVTAYGVRHITHPIQKLIQATEQVTAGQFGHQIEVKTGDEIQTLANQFNLMSAKLDDSYSSLEKKVADRTRELAILNSIISVASQSLDIQEILEDALNKTVEQMGFDAGAAFRLEPDPPSAYLMAQRGLDPAFAADVVNNYVVTSQQHTAENRPSVTTLEITDPQDQDQAADLREAGLQLLVSVPLATTGQTLGLFLLGRQELSRLSPEELALLDSIGKQVAVAMENACLYEQAEEGAVVAERHRLAREFHDAVTQTLFSANLVADVIPRIWKRNPEEGLENLEELRQLTRGALAEMRTLLLEMRPESLERSDIKSLLTQLADAFLGRVRVPVDLEINGDCKLTHDVKLAFYRIAQEALNNIAKHSGARQVSMRLACEPGHMHLLIRDDGLGFDPDSVTPGHLGIAIMRERASSIGASLEIESQLGQGTTVELDWRAAQKD
jgi:nitrate/nitrite-specific signal transduction histidine kinase